MNEVDAVLISNRSQVIHQLVINQQDCNIIINELLRRPPSTFSKRWNKRAHKTAAQAVIIYHSNWNVHIIPSRFKTISSYLCHAMSSH